MLRNDSLYLAKYEHDHDLLDKNGWKQLLRYINHTKNINHLLKYVKAKQHHNTFNIKFGMKIHRKQK